MSVATPGSTHPHVLPYTDPSKVKVVKAAHIKQLMATPGTYRVKIDAKAAEELLKHNTHNRNIIEGEVLKWATDMEDGRWMYTGESIKTSNTNALLDGQHRLTAVVLVGNVVIEILLVTGLPDESQTPMDVGLRRALDSQLTLSGMEINKSQASAIRTYIMWNDGWLCKETKALRGKLTIPAQVAWAHANDNVMADIKTAQKFSKIQARTGLVMATYAIFKSENTSDRVDMFFERLLDGANLSVDSPILALRNRLGKIVTDRLRVSDKDVLAMFIVAFNAFVKDRKLTKIQTPSGGWNADNFPKISSK